MYKIVCEIYHVIRMYGNQNENRIWACKHLTSFCNQGIMVTLFLGLASKLTDENIRSKTCFYFQFLRWKTIERWELFDDR